LINNILTKREFRDRLVERVEKVKAEKLQVGVQEDCEHTFKKFKETIRPSNPSFAYTAYFIVKGCTKCKYKVRVDYKII
jgi:hypothetical protein